MQWWQELFVYVSVTSRAGRTGEGGESCPFNCVVSRAHPPLFVVLGLLSTELHAASLWQLWEVHYTVACHCLHLDCMAEGGGGYCTARCVMQQMIHCRNTRKAVTWPGKITVRPAGVSWVRSFVHLQRSICVRGGNGITEQIWVTVFK